MASMGRQTVRGRFDAEPERSLIADHVISRQCQENGRRIFARHMDGRGGDRRGGIPPRRLDHDIGRKRNVRELLRQEKAVLVAREHKRSAKQGRARDPLQRRLKCRAVAEERDELLRPAPTRGRPQPRACSAAEHNGDDFPV